MEKHVTFMYKNHRGEVRERRVVPMSLAWVPRPGFGYQPGWFLTGRDIDKADGGVRGFALTHVVLPDGAAGFMLWESL